MFTQCLRSKTAIYACYATNAQTRRGGQCLRIRCVDMRNFGLSMRNSASLRMETLGNTWENAGRHCTALRIKTRVTHQCAVLRMNFKTIKLKKCGGGGNAAAKAAPPQSGGAAAAAAANKIRFALDAVCAFWKNLKLWKYASSFIGALVFQFWSSGIWLWAQFEIDAVSTCYMKSMY